MAVVVLLAIFSVWFFFLRASPGSNAVTHPPPRRPAIGQTVQYSVYVGAISHALDDVRTARSASGDARKKAVNDTITTLEKVEGGAISNGKYAAEIDNTAIISELRENDPNLAAVESDLSLLAQAVNASGSARVEGTLDGQAAKVELERVLSDQAFNYEHDLSPLQRLAQWLSSVTGQADPDDTLWQLFIALLAAVASGVLTYLGTEQRLSSRWMRLALSGFVGVVVGLLFYAGLGALTSVLGVVSVTVIGILGATGLVVAVLAVALIGMGAHRASSPARPRSLSDLAAVLGMSAAEGRKRADEAAGAGDFRSAVRYRCLALLLSLDEAGMLAFDRTATNREYLFRAPGTLQDDLQPLLSRFDAIWYGGAPTSEQEWQQYSARASQIEARVAGEQRSAA